MTTALLGRTRVKDAVQLVWQRQVPTLDYRIRVLGWKKAELMPKPQIVHGHVPNHIFPNPCQTASDTMIIVFV